MQYTVEYTEDFDIRKPGAFKNAPLGVLLCNDGANTGAKYRPATKFSLLKSNTYLYFVLYCKDGEPKASMTEYNAPLYEEEVAEIFVCPDGKGCRYFELEINALGAIFAAQIDRNAAGENTINLIAKNPCESVVKNTKTGWTAKGRIPLSVIFEGKRNLSTCTGNVYRIKRTAQNDMALGAFSPTGEQAFHRPKKFAKLTFA